MPVQYLLSCPKVAGHSNGWSDIPSKKEANIKGGEKTMGGKIKKGRKKLKKKEKRKSQQNKRKEREGRGEEDRMKNRKEKERKKSWDQVFKQKEVLCWD